MPSPKRLSLDERLERELGIKPDYSRPPPGYLPTGERLTTTDGASSMAPPPHPGAHSYPPHAGGDAAAIRHHHHHHGEMSSEGLQKGSYSSSNRSHHPADPPEEGRLVRVGNMLQVTTSFVSQVP